MGHFASKFVRVTKQILQQHFPSELLSKRLLNGKGGKCKSSTVAAGSAICRNDSGKDDMDWENLDDDNDYDFDGGVVESNISQKEKIDTSSSPIEDESESDELWTKLERLLRMRFETEGRFRI